MGEVQAVELPEKPKLQTEEVKPKQLELVDTEELLNRLKSKSTTEKVSTTVSTQATTQKTTAEISADGSSPQPGIVGGLSVKLSTPRAEVTTLSPTLEESITEAISHSTTSKKEPTITTINVKDDNRSSTKTPSSNTVNKDRKLSPTIETAINSGSSLEEVLANLPKEKLEEFKKYLLTLDNEDKKLVSRKLKKNLENAKKFKTTTESASQVEDGEPVIDLGILGSFRLELPKRTVFEDELFDNQIRTERPSPVFRPQD